MISFLSLHSHGYARTWRSFPTKRRSVRCEPSAIRGRRHAGSWCCPIDIDAAALSVVCLLSAAAQVSRGEGSRRRCVLVSGADLTGSQTHGASARARASVRGPPIPACPRAGERARENTALFQPRLRHFPVPPSPFSSSPTAPSSPRYAETPLPYPATPFALSIPSLFILRAPSVTAFLLHASTRGARPPQAPPLKYLPFATLRQIIRITHSRGCVILAVTLLFYFLFLFRKCVFLACGETRFCWSPLGGLGSRPFCCK